MSSDTVYNLQRIDQLGASSSISDSGNTIFNSQEEITLQPNAQVAGGSGSGGQVNISNADQILDSVSIYSQVTSFSGLIQIKDTASSGTRYMSIRYKSDISGSVDTTANRQLSIDLEGGDRNLILAQDLTVKGGGSLSFQTIASTAWILPPNNGTNGQLLQTDGAGTLTWVTSAASSTVQSYTTTWLQADGATKVVTHGLNSQDIAVFIRELSSNEYVSIDTIIPIGTNSVQLTASESPDSSNWKVYVIAN